MIDMTKGTVLFDLDGTIADSQEGIVNIHWATPQ